MAAKLRRRFEVFTNGMLADRALGRPPHSLRKGAASFRRLLGDDAIVVPMAANPESERSIGRIDCQCTIVSTYADGMEATYALEVQRRVTRIRCEKLELFISQVANRLRQFSIATPEARRRLSLVHEPNATSEIGRRQLQVRVRRASRRDLAQRCRPLKPDADHERACNHVRVARPKSGAWS